MRKKGISAVVATILIVLLAVVAVVIVWAVLKPAITKSAGKVSTNCLEVDLTIDSVSCSVGTANVKVTLNQGNVSSLKIAVYNSTDSQITTISTGLPQVLETKTYTGTVGGTATGANVAAVIGSDTGNTQVCSFVSLSPIPCS